jgi:polyvinyl alcohol dehydrogenase (cytochrome)
MTPPALAVAGATSPGSHAARAHCAPARPAAGEWRSYGHDLANTRSQPKEHVITPLKAATLHKAFAFSASDGGGDGDFTGTPAIADGCLFVSSNSGWVFAANADNGASVWSAHVADGDEITGSAAVRGGRVYVAVQHPNGPYVAALDEKTGHVLWRRTIDHQEGDDVYGSPVVFDGILIIGVSGGTAELGSSEERDAFEGAFVLIETRGKHPGRILRKTWTVHAPHKNAKQGGATVWSTPAIDPKGKAAYVGTGNPFHPESQPPTSDAIIKIDLNRSHKTFGRIIGHYDGTIEEYDSVGRKLPCYDIPGNPAPYYPQGLGACGDLDLDFGASPNLIHEHGRLLVGAGQKSGYYHLIDARTMKGVWKTVVGPPSQFGGVVGSTAYAHGRIFGPVTIGGYVWSLDAASGQQKWVAPVADGAHWGDPVATADGVVYSVGLTGFLDAYDANTGAPLLHHPMAADVSPGDPAASWGGVSIARHTVYATVGMTGLPNGYVIGYRPAAVPVGGGARDTTVQAPAAAAPPSEVVSGPQAQSYGYLTPLVVTTKGGTVTYTNVDLVRHDVVQDVAADHVHGSRKAKWCKQFRKHRCPLFWTPLIGLGEKTSILGLNRTKPGTYNFYCTLHPGMKGKLVILK